MPKTPPKTRQILVELRSPILETFLARCDREKRKPKNLAEFLIEQGVSATDNLGVTDPDRFIERLRDAVSSK